MMNFSFVLAFFYAVLAAAQTFNNPVLWEDLADLDIIRVDSTYYYSSSTMHYSPGAPVLRSYDLVNWEYIGHSVPTLDFGSQYNLGGQQAYINGIWASSFRYRKSNNKWYWIGCIDFSKTYVYTASSPSGPWTKSATINTCYYDVGLFIDDNDTMYVAYGNTQISVAQLSADGLSQVKSQQVFDAKSLGVTLEGSRMYKIKGSYYIWATQPANGQWVLKSSSPFGPYTAKNVLLNTGSPTTINGGVPHQGGLVDTPAGNWYYMAFVDSYPGGRIPALAPVTFGSDGWPTIQFSSGNKWPTSLNYPVTKKLPDSPAGAFTDTFTSSSLGPEWEWNHNPDTSKFSISSGLKLTTATVTNDLYQARNTLTHRILGPQSYATITLDYTNMKDGDRAGFAMLRDFSAYIAVVNNGGTYRVSMVTGYSMNTADWSTKSTGSEAAGATINSATKKIYFRIAANITPGANRPANFYYSTDGSTFSSLGPALSLNSDWQFFMGYRYAIFNYATKSAGGSVTLQKFDMQPGTAPANGTPQTTTVVTKTSATSSTPVTSPGPSGSAGTCAAMYGQCGGDTWTGPTCCAAGSCKFSNQYYSQCL